MGPRRSWEHEVPRAAETKGGRGWGQDINGGHQMQTEGGEEGTERHTEGGEEGTERHTRASLLVGPRFRWFRLTHTGRKGPILIQMRLPPQQ